MKTLVKRNGNLFPSMPSLFDDFFIKDFFSWPDGNFTSGNDTLPAVNVKESDNSFELEVAAPGMTKKDFNVELDNNRLIISAQRESKEEEKDRDGNYTRREFSYQSFQRSFNLPEHMIKGDQISAKYTDGILHITVPKAEAAKVKGVKQIEIS